MVASRPWLGAHTRWPATARSAKGSASRKRPAFSSRKASMSADDELAAMIFVAGGVNCTPGKRRRRNSSAADGTHRPRFDVRKAPSPEMVELLAIAAGQRRQGAAPAAIVRTGPLRGRNGQRELTRLMVHAAL